VVRGTLPPLPTSCCCSCGCGAVRMVTGHYGQYDAFKPRFPQQKTQADDAMMMHVAGGHVMMTGSCRSRGKDVAFSCCSAKADECVNTEGLSGRMQALIHCA